MYLQRRVLIVLLLGFSSGLPLALSGSTLLVWMRESGVDLGTIGLFALVGTPYTLKFLWAPLVDALHVPFFTRASRPPARLAGVLAIAADRRHPAAGADRSRRARRCSWRSARCWWRRCRRRRTSWSMRFASRACRRASRPPAWRPMSRPTGSACWSRPPARCSWSARSRATGIARASAWMWGYVAMAALVLIGTRHRAGRHRARAIGARGSRDQQRERVHARDARRGRRVLGIPDAQGCARGARLRGAVQVHRRVFRHHDRAVRDRPRLHPQRLRRHRQGRRPCRDPDRRFRRRLRGAALFAARQPVDRRRAAGGRQPVVLLAGAGRRQSNGRWRLRSRRRISPAPSAP